MVLSKLQRSVCRISIDLCSGPGRAYSNQEEYPVHIESRKQGFVKESEGYRRRYGVLDVPRPVLARTQVQELNARIH